MECIMKVLGTKSRRRYSSGCIYQCECAHQRLYILCTLLLIVVLNVCLFD